jgi:hypothetical protein
MLTVFLEVNGLVKILPEGQKVPSQYSKDEILHAIYRGSLGGWRLGRVTHLTPHSDNAPVHNAKRASERLTKYELLRLTHPPDSPDLSPCDFFLFG